MNFAEAAEKLFPQEKTYDGLLITKTENIGYLTGFWGTFGRLLITAKCSVLVSDARYSETAKARCVAQKIQYREWQHEEDFWPQLCHELQILTLGYEAHDLTVEKFERLRKNFAPKVELVKTNGLIEKLRFQKTPEERDIMKKAAHITDRTLEFTLPYLQEGVTEKEIAWILEKTAREEFGAEGMSFPPIVAFGPDSAIPHSEPSAKKLQKNMAVLIDFGVKYKKYCSDMTRSFFFGKPSQKWRETYELVLQAQEAGLQNVRIGKKLSVPDQAARSVFAEKEEYFCHSFGHGVGLEIHESPHLSKKSEGEFLENMVVTAEPGLYFPGEFGIRIEDLVIVGKTAQVISYFPKDLESMILVH